MCTMRVAACTDKEASFPWTWSHRRESQLPSVGAENEIRILWKSSSPLQLFFNPLKFYLCHKKYHTIITICCFRCTGIFNSETCWIWTQFCVIRTLPSSSVKTRTRPIQYFCFYYLVKEQAYKAPVNKLYEKWKNIHSLHFYIMYIRISRNTTDIFLLLTLIVHCGVHIMHSVPLISLVSL